MPRLAKRDKVTFLDSYIAHAVSNYLSNNDITIMNTNYTKILDKIDAGDFVYFDPPYHPVSKTASFTRYTKDSFTINDQFNLKSICDKLTLKKVNFMMSNSNSEFMCDLYKDYFITDVDVRRRVNVDPTKRGRVKELLISNYDTKK